VFSVGTQTGFSDTPGSNATLTFAAVPEVSTWTMMLVGFAGVGACLRRYNGALSAA
jgi:hypothetical protein